MKTIYIADFRHGKSNLAKVKLVRETPKTLFVEKPKQLMGWLYIPKSSRLSKEKYNSFPSGQEALAFLASQAEKHVEALGKQLRKAVQERDRLHRIIEEGEKHEM